MRQVQLMSLVPLSAAPLQVLSPAAVEAGCLTSATCIGHMTPAFTITTDKPLSRQRLMVFEFLCTEVRKMSSSEPFFWIGCTVKQRLWLEGTKLTPEKVLRLQWVEPDTRRRRKGGKKWQTDVSLLHYFLIFKILYYNEHAEMCYRGVMMMISRSSLITL